jgi:Fur family transcriptional regulator, peroxide stress response regulator
METLVQKFRAHGLAVTPQRLAVLGFMQARQDHPSAETIYAEVRRQLPAISFNTVYKTLEVLVEKGLVIKVNPLHEMARYDADASQHAHLICRRCYRIVDLKWQPTEAVPFSAGDLQGFQVEHQSLTLWGICPQCRHPEAPREE